MLAITLFIILYNRGDNLSKIAEKFDGITWQEIYELNKETIGDNPNLIYAGLKLMIRRN